MAKWHIVYCMQDVHNILQLYCNANVVVIKPVTERARICSASLKTTRRLIALGFRKENEVCQHSHFSDPVPVHTIRAICRYILPYAIYWYVEVSVLNCIALCRIAISLHIGIL